MMITYVFVILDTMVTNVVLKLKTLLVMDGQHKIIELAEDMEIALHKMNVNVMWVGMGYSVVIQKTQYHVMNGQLIIMIHVLVMVHVLMIIYVNVIVVTMVRDVKVMEL